MISEATERPIRVVINYLDYKHCDEIQDDCFLKAVDDAVEKGCSVMATIPKTDWNEVIRDFLFKIKCRIVIV